MLSHPQSAPRSPRPEPDVDVVVVGAGLAGLTIAAALARSGVSVLVIEKHPGLSVFPKATGLRPRTMEILRSWGLEQTVLDQSQPTRLSMLVTPRLGVHGTEVSMGLPTDEEALGVSPSRIALCPQDRLEQILLTHLLEQGGDVRFETTLVGIEQDSDRGDGHGAAGGSAWARNLAGPLRRRGRRRSQQRPSPPRRRAGVTRLRGQPSGRAVPSGPVVGRPRRAPRAHPRGEPRRGGHAGADGRAGPVDLRHRVAPEQR